MVEGYIDLHARFECGCVVVVLQEAFGSSGQPSKLRRVALDFSSPQLSPQRGLRSPSLDGRTGSGFGAASGGGGGGGESPGQSLRSPSGQFRRSSLLGAITSSIRYWRASLSSHDRLSTSD